MTEAISNAMVNDSQIFIEERRESQPILNEILNVRFEIENLNWVQFSQKQELIKVYTMVGDFNISPIQTILLENNLAGSTYTKISVAKSDTIITYIRNSVLRILPIITKDGLTKGLLIVQTIDNDGLIVYLPYFDKKKIYGYFTQEAISERDNVLRFYFNNTINNNDLIPNIINIPEFRPLEENLTDEDKILLSSSSAKFKRSVENGDWIKVKDVLIELKYLLTHVSDPNYIEKIITICKSLTI